MTGEMGRMKRTAQMYGTPDVAVDVDEVGLGAESAESRSTSDRGAGRVGSRVAQWANPKFALIYGLLIMIVVYSVLMPGIFLTTRNFQSVFNISVATLLLGLAITPLIIAGELDLSVAGTFGLSGVIAAYLNVTVGLAVGWAILIALMAGLLIGALNAAMIVRYGADSLVVTLGVGAALAGITLGITTQPVSGLSEVLVASTGTRLGGIQVVFFIAIVVLLTMYYVWRFTPLGRYLFFVGSNREVSQLSGIPVARLRAGSIIFGSVFAAFAGVVVVGAHNSVDPTTGSAYLLPVYAAVFLGSTVLTPGRFNPLGTAIAVFFLQIGTQGLQLLGLTGWVEQVFYGASLVVAVALPNLLRGRRRSRSTT